MVVPPNHEHKMWDTVRHPKFPAEGSYTLVTKTQKRRLQRKFAGRLYGASLDFIDHPTGNSTANSVPKFDNQSGGPFIPKLRDWKRNMVWKRDQEKVDQLAYEPRGKVAKVKILP